MVGLLDASMRRRIFLTTHTIPVISDSVDQKRDSASASYLLRKRIGCIDFCLGASSDVVEDFSVARGFVDPEAFGRDEFVGPDFSAAAKSSLLR